MGVSKNAVVGKSHRIDLTPRPSPIRAATSSQPLLPQRPRCLTLATIENPTSNASSSLMAPTSTLKIHQAHEAATPAFEPRNQASSPVPVAQIGHSPCRWPDGQPGTPSFRFCEAPNEPGKPYCPAHCRTAYRNWKADRAAA
jgi:GcrA cell cycle regulator